MGWICTQHNTVSATPTLAQSKLLARNKRPGHNQPSLISSTAIPNMPHEPHLLAMTKATSRRSPLKSAPATFLRSGVQHGTPDPIATFVFVVMIVLQAATASNTPGYMVPTGALRRKHHDSRSARWCCCSLLCGRAASAVQCNVLTVQCVHMIVCSASMFFPRCFSYGGVNFVTFFLFCFSFLTDEFVFLIVPRRRLTYGCRNAYTKKEHVIPACLLLRKSWCERAFSPHHLLHRRLRRREDITILSIEVVIVVGPRLPRTETEGDHGEARLRANRDPRGERSFVHPGRVPSRPTIWLLCK